ncbi:exported protein of unknown function (plasmid) [Caballeronia sp. S22]
MTMNVSRFLFVLLVWPLAVRADEMASPSPELIARGAYLAKAADCAGCHTAPSNAAPYASRLGMTSPFGTIVSSNITPDRETRIGTYSYEDFAKALREGIAPGGKGPYPAMPYPAFAKISDDDLRALYAFMMHSVPPVIHRPPERKCPFRSTSAGRCACGAWRSRRSSRFNRTPIAMRAGIAAPIQPR